MKAAWMVITALSLWGCAGSKPVNTPVPVSQTPPSAAPEVQWQALNPMVGGRECRIQLVQAGRTLSPVAISNGWKYTLKAEPFQLTVSPAECRPKMATPASAAVLRKVFQRPLVYGSIGFVMAQSPQQSGDLMFPVQDHFSNELMQPPDSKGFQGRQFQEFCRQLGYCPSTYPDAATGVNFENRPDGTGEVARYRQLKSGQPLSAGRGKTLTNIMYTRWKDLPNQYPMADPVNFLLQPHVIAFTFE
jgi:hypothetical protein